MADERGLMSIIVWLVGIIVSLAVGFGMINQTLIIGVSIASPIIPIIITQIAGWIVVIGAIISLIMAIFQK